MFRKNIAFFHRYFNTIARNISSSSSSTTTSTSELRSIVRQVYPFSNIEITCNYNLNIKPYDVLECPNGNLLRVSLETKSNNKLASKKFAKILSNLDAIVQIADENIVINTVDALDIEVDTDELTNAFECLIEVPIKSNLKVTGERDVNIQNMYSDDISVTTYGDISTKNIYSINLNMIAKNGNIRCDGTTLAQKMDVRSEGVKIIHLNKVLGDSLTAVSENGIISTNSCYAENSKFITQKGGLHLKNVHKKSELHLLDGGDVEVTGFHGVLNAKTNGGTLNFQFTEIYGDSCIEAQNPTNFNVNISEFVEEHTCIQINANQITLDATLEHFEKIQTDDGGSEELITLNRDIIDDSLTIRTNGNIKLGKLSWMETIKLKLSAKEDTE